MLTLGHFTRTDDGAYAGALRTLTLAVKAVVIRPVLEPAAKGPDFRVFAGDLEIGAAWTKTGADGQASLSVRLDDPAFPSPLDARLIAAKDSWRLTWIRRARR